MQGWALPEPTAEGSPGDATIRDDAGTYTFRLRIVDVGGRPRRPKQRAAPQLVGCSGAGPAGGGMRCRRASAMRGSSSFTT